jgi:hypothetical protein
MFRRPVMRLRSAERTTRLPLGAATRDPVRVAAFDLFAMVAPCLDELMLPLSRNLRVTTDRPCVDPHSRHREDELHRAKRSECPSQGALWKPENE